MNIEYGLMTLHRANDGMNREEEKCLVEEKNINLLFTVQ